MRSYTPISISATPSPAAVLADREDPYPPPSGYVSTPASPSPPPASSPPPPCFAGSVSGPSYVVAIRKSGCTLPPLTTSLPLLLPLYMYVLSTMAYQTPARARNAAAGGDARSGRLRSVVILRTDHVVVVRFVPPLPLSAAVVATATEDAACG